MLPATARRAATIPRNARTTVLNESFYVEALTWALQSIEELFSNYLITDIVVGEVVKTEVLTYNGYDYYEEELLSYRVSTFKVEQTIKGGTYAGQNLLVAQPGDGETVIWLLYESVEDYLTEGTRVLLFYPKKGLLGQHRIMLQ